MTGPDGADLTGDIEQGAASAARWAKRVALTVAGIAAVVALVGYTRAGAWWLVEPAHAQDQARAVGVVTAAAEKRDAAQNAAILQVSQVATERAERIEGMLAVLMEQSSIRHCKATLHGEWLGAGRCLLPGGAVYDLSTGRTVTATPTWSPKGSGHAPAPTAVARKPRRRQPVEELLPTISPSPSPSPAPVLAP